MSLKLKLLNYLKKSYYEDRWVPKVELTDYARIIVNPKNGKHYDAENAGRRLRELAEKDVIYKDDTKDYDTYKINPQYL